MSVIGSLVVSLRADSATFASDLGKAVTMAEASANKMAKSLGKINDAFGMLAAGFGFEQLLHYSTSVIEATAHLGELSAATGLTVPALSSLSVTAKAVGMTVDDAAMSFDRMQRQAALAVGGSRTQAEAFAAVGINAKQLAIGLKDPQALLLQVAGAMEKFADDGNKTALMMTIFGKGGAGMTSMLHELAAGGYENANATAEQAKQAQAFEKEMAQLGGTIQSWTRTALMSIIPTVQLVGASMITAFSDAWIHMKYETEMETAWFKDKFTDLKQFIVNLGASIGGAFGIPVDTAMKKSTGASVASLRKEMEDQLAQNDRIRKEAAKAYTDAMAPPVVAAAAKKPSAPNLPSGKVPIQHDMLAQEMTARLKIVSDAMKLEDATTKLGMKQLDEEYGQGLSDLASYTQRKLDLLSKDNALTQSLYDVEIRIAQTTADRLAAMIAKTPDNEKNAQRRLVMQKEMESAQAKAGEMQAAQALSQISYAEKLIAENEKTMKSQADLARTVLDTSMAYATMTGDTVLANALQTELTDRTTRTALATGNFTEALKQLDAIKEQRRMAASKDPYDGMMRSMIAYKNGLTDLAKATESMTTKMLQGMEDALVSFVQTGKLSWRGLMDSMIADLIRMQIRAQVMPAISGWLSGAMGLMGAAVGGGAGAATSGSMGGMMAAGGPVTAGTPYTIGERGPEKFVPNVSGTIVPNGTGGGTQITYAPTIQIDSRADRAQVQVDTARAVRQGQQELLILLRRYNPGLRV